MPEVNMTELLATTMEEMEKDMGQSFEQKAKMLKMMMKMQALPTNQKGRTFPVYTDPNPSIRYRNESGAFAPGDTHKAKAMKIFYARLGITRRLSGDVLDLGDRGTIINAFTDGMDMDINTLLKDINQEVWSDATGTKALYASGTGTATLTFSLPLGALRLLKGGQYQFYDPATGAARSATIYTISSVDKTNRQATFTTTVSGLTAGDAIAWVGSYLNTITGMEKLIADDTGDFQGVSRSDVPSLKSPNVNANSRRLTLSLVDQQEIQLGIRAGELGSDDLSQATYWTHPTQVQAVRDLGRNYQQYQSGTNFDGGNGGINNQTLNGRKINTDVDCKYTDLWLLNMKDFRYCELRALGIVDRDGRKIRLVPGYDSAGAGSWLDSGVYMIDTKFDVGNVAPQRSSRMYSLDTTGLTSPHFN